MKGLMKLTMHNAKSIYTKPIMEGNSRNPNHFDKMMAIVAIVALIGFVYAVVKLIF
tara:strand:- start:790 stop:957 length:168 start_codon:yes stop_codon:yes gene_type:complete